MREECERVVRAPGGPALDRPAVGGPALGRRPLGNRAGGGPTLVGLAWLLFACGAASAAAVASHLQVRTDEPGYPVWVNQRYAGLTPVRVDSVPAGEALVEIGAPLTEEGWVRPWKQAVQLRAGEGDTLDLGRLQRLQIRTDPAGASVSVDSESCGRTPLRLLLPARRAHSISLAYPGAPGRTIGYLPGARPDSTLKVDLGGAPSAPAPVRASFRAPWGERARIVLPLGAVLTGVAGVWARQTADRAYSAYQRTLDRDRMSEELRRSRRYDHVSVACWITAEACLAGAVWTWMHGHGGR